MVKPFVIPPIFDDQVGLRFQSTLDGNEFGRRTMKTVAISLRKLCEGWGTFIVGIESAPLKRLYL
jgi:hypothetical protein